MKKYYSQYRQDEFLDAVIFPFKKNGFFLDIGAHDGIKFSNSYFFEVSKHWKGVCFEPNPEVFKRLIENRKSHNYNVCVGDSDSEVTFCQIKGYSEMLSGIKEFYDERHFVRIHDEIKIYGGSLLEIIVPVRKLTSISELKNLTIDFASIDTEGNELSILKAIDFEKISISSIAVENNYNDTSISDFLNAKSYKRIIRLGSDEIYLKSDLISSAVKVRTILWKIRKRFKYNLGQQIFNYF